MLVLSKILGFTSAVVLQCCPSDPLPAYMSEPICHSLLGGDLSTEVITESDENKRIFLADLLVLNSEAQGAASILWRALCSAFPPSLLYVHGVHAHTKNAHRALFAVLIKYTGLFIRL